MTDWARSVMMAGGLYLARVAATYLLEGLPRAAAKEAGQTRRLSTG